jgi:DNA (cytosine-5)-methyltransferase 1
MEICGIDLFAGAGGLSEGFIQAGFKIVATVEKEKWACETLKTRHIYHHLKNISQLDDYWEYCRNTLSPYEISENREKIYQKNPGLKEEIENTIWQAEFGDSLTQKDVYSAADIIKLLEQSVKFHNSDIKFILGGPPCQAYSIVGRSRMGDAVKNDRRNYLFKYYYEVVKHFQPDFFLFENVPGIITANDGLIFKMIQEDFAKIDYDFLTGRTEDIRKNFQLASNFGVPQNRKRFIFIGIRRGVKLEHPLFSPFSLNEQLSTQNAIADLPFLKPRDGNDHGLIPYPENSSLSEYQKTMRNDSQGIMNHRARPLNKWYDKEIYKLAIQKAQRNEILHYSELPPELKTHKNEKHFEDRFKVHWWDKIPHTIVAHLAKDGHYNIHPDIRQLRSLTVREAARIQSFPDNFKFEGPRTAQFIQVGNAVPPLMAKAFATDLRNQLERKKWIGMDL